MKSLCAVHINGFLLPEVIVTCIIWEKWKFPADERIVRRVFPKDEPEHGQILFGFGQLVTENAHWGEDPFAHLPPEQVAIGAGRDIDPTKILLIGALGYGFPIALDYTSDTLHPAVVYHVNRPLAHWEKAARDAVQFVRALGIQP